MNIGSNIKKLRHEHDITQEQLANYLNISVSAISQWESGKTTPDISLLAPLTNIFDVSADVLLGIDVVNKEKRIQDIISNAEKYQFVDCDKTLSILREGLKEYPNSFNIMERIMAYNLSAITRQMNKTTMTKDEVQILTNETIKLGEKILAECTDDRIRLWASNTLCLAYSSPEAGMNEKAIEIAKKMPTININRESLLARLYKGEKQLQQMRENINSNFGKFIVDTNHMIQFFYGGEKSVEYEAFTTEEAIAVRKKIIAMIDIMIEDGNYGYFWLMMLGNYFGLALDYAKLNDYNKAIEYLQLSSDNAIKIDTEYDKFSEYTSLLLKGTPQMISFINNDNFSMRHIEQMKNTAFDPIREREAFIKIEEKLKRYSIES